MKKRYFIPIFLFFSLLLIFFNMLISRKVDINSDKAISMYAAWDVMHGNFFLKGWNFPDTTFLTTDFPFYIAGMMFAGISNRAYTVTVGLMTSCFIFISLLLSYYKNKCSYIYVRILLPILLLMPLPLSYMQDLTVHIGAPCYSLLMYFFVCKYFESKRSIYILAISALCFLGAAGEMLFILHGTLPLFLYCFMKLLKNEVKNDYKAYITILVVALFFSFLGRVFNHYYYILGGINKSYTVGTACFTPIINWGDKFLEYIEIIFRYNSIFISDRYVFDVVNLISIGVNVPFVFLGFYFAVKSINDFLKNKECDIISVFLSFGIFLLFGFYIFVKESTARYINYTAMALLILNIRNFSMHYEDKMFKKNVFANVLILCAVMSLLMEIIRIHSTPVRARPHTLSILESHNLKNGYASFWNASVNSVWAKDAIKIRHITYDAKKRHVKKRTYFNKNIWYDDFANFVITKNKDEDGITTENVMRTFGPPQNIYKDGEYEVLVYDFDLSKIMDKD